MEQICCVQIECILVLKIDYWGNVVSDHKEELEGEGGGGVIPVRHVLSTLYTNEDGTKGFNTGALFLLGIHSEPHF